MTGKQNGELIQFLIEREHPSLSGVVRVVWVASPRLLFAVRRGSAGVVVHTGLTARHPSLMSAVARAAAAALEVRRGLTSAAETREYN